MIGLQFVALAAIGGRQGRKVTYCDHQQADANEGDDAFTTARVGGSTSSSLTTVSPNAARACLPDHPLLAPVCHQHGSNAQQRPQHRVACLHEEGIAERMRVPAMSRKWWANRSQTVFRAMNAANASTPTGNTDRNHEPSATREELRARFSHSATPVSARRRSGPLD